MENVIRWIATHPAQVMELLLAVVGLASIIVKITPTQKDDKIFGKAMKVLDKIALNKKE